MNLPIPTPTPSESESASQSARAEPLRDAVDPQLPEQSVAAGTGTPAPLPNTATGDPVQLSMLVLAFGLLLVGSSVASLVMVRRRDDD